MKNYQIATRGISFDHFEDETVAVNLPRGNYYSLRFTADFIFRQLVSGNNAEKVAVALTLIYDVEYKEALKAANQFIDQLLVEELLKEAEAEGEIEIVQLDEKKEFTFPVLEIFDDMQEMLVLDPVHDVDSTQGWPLKK
ncbi:PqqD family protein [Runella sp.]|uniref:PqqD family protein n=1 Tax=Runella sp. TaxID=1960881 RepID=UPI003D0DE97C